MTPRRAGDGATVGEILAAQAEANRSMQWQLPVVVQRQQAKRNTKPRHWRVDPQTHKLEEVEG